MRWIFWMVYLSSLFLIALSWVCLIFYSDFFSYSRAASCFFKCLSSFSLSTILLMSYLLSRFFLKRAISCLFFWMRLYWSLSYFLSYWTRSSSSIALDGLFFFFFLYRSFYKISSIFTASSFNWDLSLMCWSTNLALEALSVIIFVLIDLI